MAQNERNMHALKYLLLFCPLALAQNSTSNGTVVNGGNFLTDAELLSCWNYLNASQSNVTGSVYSYDYVTFAQHMATPPGELDNIHKFSSLPVLVRRAFTKLACLCRRPLFGGNNSDLQCCVGSAAHIRVTPSPAFNLSQTDESYIRTVCSVTTLATDFATPAPSPISATAATTTMMPTTTTLTTMPTTTMLTNMTPTVSVTSAPTMLSTTIAPTTMPTTLVSTMMPTASASTSQPTATTMSPTGAGGGGGGGNGTVQPTSQPGPTAEPTLTPTKMPSPAPPSTNLDVYYVIFVASGNTTQGKNATFINSYELDLVRAMNILAQEVLTETTSSESRRSLRRLATQLQWPTTITNLTNIPCPSSVNSTSKDLCQNVTHQLTLTTDSNSTNLTTFQNNLYTAISNGRFESQVQAANPQSPVTILGPGVPLAPAPAPSGKKGLSIGGIAGIVIAILAVLTAVISYVIYFTTEEDGAEIAKDDPDDEPVQRPPPEMALPRSITATKTVDENKESEEVAAAAKVDLGQDIVAEPGLDAAQADEAEGAAEPDPVIASRVAALTQSVDEEDLGHALITAAQFEPGEMSDRSSFVSTGSLNSAALLEELQKDDHTDSE